MLSDRQKIFSKNLAEFILWIYAQDCAVTFGEVWRSHEEAKLQAGKGAGIINSLHCDRLAADLNIFDEDGNFLITPYELSRFGNQWKRMHADNNWGGDFTTRLDADHFSMSDGVSNRK